MDSNNTIHTLWIGHTLSAMELLTMQSFLDHGYSVNVWSYSEDLKIPAGAIWKDANEIIPEKDIFSYRHTNKYGHGKGSYAGFSDIFRYKLLYEKGGIWVDTDITCLKKLDISTPYFFRHHHSIGLVGNVLKAPAQSPLMRWCYEQAVKTVQPDNKEWLLPVEILKKGVLRFELSQYIGDISNQDSFPIVRTLLFSDKKLRPEWKVIHWMNEEFRRLNISKSVAVSGSAYEQLLNKHQIPHQVATDKEKRTLWLKTSKIQYTWLNLKARWQWYREKFSLQK